MPHPYRHVTLQDRRIIFCMINEQRPIEEVANRTGFHRSTIYREIGRNKITPEPDNRPYRYYLHRRTEGYCPLSVNERVLARRQRQRKLIAKPELLQHVVSKLEDFWSPQQIAARMVVENLPIGKIFYETIYQYAYSNVGRAAGTHLLLAKARKRRRTRFGRKPRKSPVPIELAIHNRPKHIDERQEFGHWEADLMIFRQDLRA